MRRLSAVGIESAARPFDLRPRLFGVLCMRPLILSFGLMTVLAACSPAEKGNVNQARSELKAAGSDASAAARQLAAAAERDANAATSNTLDKAGDDLRRDAKRGPDDPS